MQKLKGKTYAQTKRTLRKYFWFKVELANTLEEEIVMAHYKHKYK